MRRATVGFCGMVGYWIDSPECVNGDSSTTGMLICVDVWTDEQRSLRSVIWIQSEPRRTAEKIQVQCCILLARSRVGKCNYPPQTECKHCAIVCNELVLNIWLAFICILLTLHSKKVSIDCSSCATVLNYELEVLCTVRNLQIMTTECLLIFCYMKLS